MPPPPLPLHSMSLDLDIDAGAPEEPISDAQPPHSTPEPPPRIEEGAYPLTDPTHERFAQLVAKGETQRKAFMGMKQRKKPISKYTADSGASRMLRENPDIRPRIAYLRGSPLPSPQPNRYDPTAPVEPAQPGGGSRSGKVDEKRASFDLDSVSGKREFLKHMASAADTPDQHAIKAVLELCKIDDVESQVQEAKRDADPSRICDTLARAHLQGESPGDLIVRKAGGLAEAAQIVASIFDVASVVLVSRDGERAEHVAPEPEADQAGGTPPSADPA